MRKKLKINKRITFILILNILLFIIGLLYPSIINKEVISTKLTTYVEGLINSKYLINSLVKINLINNLVENTILYIFTILFLFFPIALIIYLLKSFSLGVSISSLIYVYKFKGILFSLIILLPTLINLLIITISFYYSLSYLIILIRYRKTISKKRLTKSYFKVFLFTSLLQVILSFIDAYMSYYLFKFI